MNRKILWADDEIDLLTPHILFLKSRGYDVATATNGSDALEMLEHEPFSLVLLDENMSGLSGLETLDRLHKRHPELPVVMITKSEEEDLMNQAIGNSITDYLIKPVNPKQILSSLKKILGSRQLIEESNTTGYREDFHKISEMVTEAITIQQWYEIYRMLLFWERRLLNSPMSDLIRIQKKDANTNFCKFVKRNYLKWCKGENCPAIMSNSLLEKNVVPLLKKGEKICLVVIDNFRFDQWRAIQPLLSSRFEIDEELYCSILPTSTQYARNAIFAGLTPLEIKRQYPRYWVSPEKEEGFNIYEQELLEQFLIRAGISPKFVYKKLNDSESGGQFLHKINSLKDVSFTVLVINFVDMISHSRTESKMIRELANTEAAYLSLTESWFRYSSTLEIFNRLADMGIKILLTTDHGTIKVDNPVKVVGEKSIWGNPRYKIGRNLNYDPKVVFEMTDPEDYGLPSVELSSRYIFACDNDFFVYPNNFNQYVQHYSGSFQHGGISMEEMIVPFVTLVPKK